MADKVRIELNSGAVADLLKSPEMQSLCTELAQGIARRAGSGYAYDVDTTVGKKRAWATVSTSDWRTFNHERKTNSILKALKG